MSVSSANGRAMRCGRAMRARWWQRFLHSDARIVAFGEQFGQGDGCEPRCFEASEDQRQRGSAAARRVSVRAGRAVMQQNHCTRMDATKYSLGDFAGARPFPITSVAVPCVPNIVISPAGMLLWHRATAQPCSAFGPPASSQQYAVVRMPRWRLAETLIVRGSLQ